MAKEVFIEEHFSCYKVIPLKVYFQKKEIDFTMISLSFEAIC